jgi:hypothetical protein
LILGEPFTRYSVFGTILVCAGAVLIAVFGAIGEPAHTLDQLLELLYRRTFVLWLVATILVVLLVLIGSKVVKLLSTPNRSRLSHILNVKASVISSPRAKLLRGMCFGFVSGVLSAHSLLLAKSAVELLVRTVIDGVNQFNRWQSWVILLGMIALALTQLYYMHRGLKLCSTSVLYPFVFCIYNIIAIFDGLIYFRQSSQLAGIHAALIAVGTIILLGGVLCLSWRLEAMDAQSGVTVAGTTQTALGPGMVIMERNAGPDSEDDNNETLVGERQPLLAGSGTTRHGFTYQRTPTLPLVSPYRNRAQTFGAQPLQRNESAQIWAELEDVENDSTSFEADPRSAPPHKPSFHTLLNRPRRSESLNDMPPFLRGRKQRDSSISQSRFSLFHRLTWGNDPPRAHRNSMSRRVSAPVTAPSGASSNSRVSGTDPSPRGFRTRLSTIFDMDSTTTSPTKKNHDTSHQSSPYTHSRSRSDDTEYTTPMAAAAHIDGAQAATITSAPRVSSTSPTTRRIPRTNIDAAAVADTTVHLENQSGATAYLTFGLRTGLSRLRQWTGLGSGSSSSSPVTEHGGEHHHTTSTTSTPDVVDLERGS